MHSILGTIVPVPTKPYPEPVCLADFAVRIAEINMLMMTMQPFCRTRDVTFMGVL